MRILITGATGFIGRVLVRAILEEYPDNRLLCIVRNKEQATKRLPKVEQIELVEGIDENVITQFSPEIVFHLAAYNTSSSDTEVIDKLIDSNITFGTKLLNAFAECKDLKLFVNTGSFSQYIDGRNDAYLYSATKSAFEVILKYYSRRFNIKYATLIPYSVYGGDRTVKRIMDYIIESIDSKEPIGMTPGFQRLDFIHVDDVVNAYIATISNYDVIHTGTKLHLGTGIAHSLQDLAKIVESISGGKCNIEWGARAYRPDDIMYACAPKDKIDFWEPHIGLEQGLQRLLDGIR